MAAALVLMPDAPLGLITLAVQTLAGVLLPSATVFLLLLCNDRAVLGPWVNGRWLNLFTGAVIAVLVTLSIILTAAVLYPDISDTQILWVLGGGAGLSVRGFVATWVLSRGEVAPVVAVGGPPKLAWRMPALARLAPPRLTVATRVWMGALRLYLVMAVGMVVVRVLQLAFGQG